MSNLDINVNHVPLSNGNQDLSMWKFLDNLKNWLKWDRVYARIVVILADKHNFDAFITLDPFCHRPYSFLTRCYIKLHSILMPNELQKVEDVINDTTRNEIIDLIGNGGELEQRLASRLTFGTAGIRGVMGAGFSMMNDLVVIQTSQGLASYADEYFRDRQNRSIVIGFDGRHNSKRFAELAALAMIAKGFKVYLFSEICPTPFVSFAVVHLKSQCGVMVTASHNPKEDNGYKVYWENGAQIITPHDKKIQASILNNLEPWENAWETSTLKSLPEVCDPLEDVWNKYNEILLNLSIEEFRIIGQKSNLIFTYTPMHGVGLNYMERAFKAVSLKSFVPVAEQMYANPDFPTVKFPNPEEGKSALELAIKTAESSGSTIVLANDPDADRLAVSEKNKQGTWKVFTGNELGSLLAWWTVELVKKRIEKEGSQPKKYYMLSSAVSTTFVKRLAEAEGFGFMETLTGFKWMGNKADELAESNGEVVFAFEEAIGFMCGDGVLDKDGISAGVRVAEMANYLNALGLTLEDQLNSLYEKYGYFINVTSYYICRNPKKIAAMFDNMRNRYTQEKPFLVPPPRTNPNIVSVRDLTIGLDTDQPDRRPVLPVSKSSQMVTLRFENGLILTIRASGTEPKVKYYAEFVTFEKSENWPKVRSQVVKEVEDILNDLLCPYLQDMTPQS